MHRRQWSRHGILLWFARVQRWGFRRALSRWHRATAGGGGAGEHCAMAVAALRNEPRANSFRAWYLFMHGIELRVQLEPLLQCGAQRGERRPRGGQFHFLRRPDGHPHGPARWSQLPLAAFRRYAAAADRVCSGHRGACGDRYRRMQCLLGTRAGGGAGVLTARHCRRGFPLRRGSCIPERIRLGRIGVVCKCGYHRPVGHRDILHFYAQRDGHGLPPANGGWMHRRFRGGARHRSRSATGTADHGRHRLLHR